MNPKMFLPFALVLALAACKGSADAPADEGASVDRAPAAEMQEPSRGPEAGLAGMRDAGTMHERDTTPVDASVVRVRLSNEGDAEEGTLGMETSSFGPQDTVYAEVETSGTAGAYTLYAKWTAPDGTVLSDYGMSINEAGPVRTIISLSKPDGWEPGEGRIEIAINGKVEQTVPFQVR